MTKKFVNLTGRERQDLLSQAPLVNPEELANWLKQQPEVEVLRWFKAFDFAMNFTQEL